MTVASYAQTAPVTELLLLLLLLYYFKMTVPSYPNHFLKVLSLKHTSCCAPHSPVGQVSKSEAWFPCECNGALDD